MFVADSLVNTWFRLKELFRRKFRPPKWERVARVKGLVPVFSDWVGFFVLSDAGVPLFTASPNLEGCEPLVEPDLRHFVLALASERYSRYRHLRPARTRTAVACPTCLGRGRIELRPSQRHKITCQCGGAGWVEPEWSTSEYHAHFPRKEVF